MYFIEHKDCKWKEKNVAFFEANNNSRKKFTMA